MTKSMGGLTIAEEGAMDHLVAAWNAFSVLARLYPEYWRAE